jgi:hypothetical protein
VAYNVVFCYLLNEFYREERNKILLRYEILAAVNTRMTKCNSVHTVWLY